MHDTLLAASCKQPDALWRATEGQIKVPSILSLVNVWRRRPATCNTYQAAAPPRVSRGMLLLPWQPKGDICIAHLYTRILFIRKRATHPHLLFIWVCACMCVLGMCVCVCVGGFIWPPRTSATLYVSLSTVSVYSWSQNPEWTSATTFRIGTLWLGKSLDPYCQSM